PSVDADYQIKYELFAGDTIEPGEQPIRPPLYFNSSAITVAADIFGLTSALPGNGFDLAKLAGNYTVRVTLDSNQTFREKTATGVDGVGALPNVHVLPIHIKAPDLTGNFSATFRGATPENRAEPGETVDIRFTVKNTGNAAANRAGGKPIHWKLLLDPDHNSGRPPLISDTIPSLAPGESKDLSYSLFVRGTPGLSEPELKPGLHTLRLVIDQYENDPMATAGYYTEQNESNNVVNAKFYVKDTLPPVIKGNWYFTKEERTVSPVNGVYTFQRGSQEESEVDYYWKFNVNLTEEDESFRGPADRPTGYCETCVWVDFTRAGAAPIRVYLKADKDGPQGSSSVQYDPEMWYWENVFGRQLPVGLYSMTVGAKDPSGNVAEVLKLTNIVRITGHEPKVTLLEPAVDLGNSRNITIEYPPNNPSRSITFRFNVSATGHGLNPDAINASVKATMKAATAAPDPLPLVKDYRCVDNQRNILDGSCLGGQIQPGTEGWLTGGYSFTIPRTLQLNVTVTDKANDPHYFLWNVTYRHEYPRFGNLTVAPLKAAGEDVPFEVNFTSAFGGQPWRIDRVWAEITNASGGVVSNVSLKRVGEASSTRWAGFATTGLLEDGRFGNIAQAGTYRVRFIAQDQWGAVNKSGQKLFQVTDTVAPVISDDSGPLSFPAEEGETVEFVATVRDNSRTDVELIILRSSVEFHRTKMSYMGEHQFNASVKFDVPGEYTYVFEATDSGLKKATSTASVLRVEPNTFPRVTLTPAVAKLGSPPVRYMQSNSLIEITIIDVNGVNLSSLRVLVNGQDSGAFFIDPKVSPDGNRVTLRASFSRGNVGFPEGGTVEIVVFSADKQGKRNPAGETFKLFVDDTPPVVDLRTPLVGADPANGQGRPLNVTQATTFVFDASDATGPANSYVREITVRVQSPGAAERKFVYRAEEDSGWKGSTKPLRLTPEDLGGDYYGPGLYYINVSAKDQAGNEGAPKSFLVQLYTRGPRVDLLSKAADAVQGYVNASVLDVGGVGISTVRAVATATGYAPRTTELLRGEDQVWRGRLEPFPRGTRVDFQVIAENRLGLTGASERANFTAANHAPDIRTFLAPTAGGIAKGNLVLNWTIFDLDSDTVRVGLVGKAADPALQPFQVKLSVGNDRATVDTRALDDGLWTFTLTADDLNGGLTTSEVRVWVQNHETAVLTHNVAKTTLSPGEKLVVSATAVRQNARLFLEYRADGATEWQRFAMVATSTAGVYQAEVDAPSPGTYDMRIVTEYVNQDGKVDMERRTLPSFTVESSFADVVGENGALWVAIGVLGIAAVTVGGYALSRRWK
ncbi:MAG TPA: CARDB domain-containing protein, partial [Candidatus Thermoplasmatota archaeon]|nr:CARDB domain-containing protein [Candidatus Thermoplasmatota archaeon]